MKQTEDNLEFLVNQFMREMLSKGYEKFRDMQNEKRKSPLDEMGELFERFKQGYEGRQTDEDPNKTAAAMELEIRYLKMQVEQLKQQLADKDELIELLKKQGKKPKKS